MRNIPTLLASSVVGFCGLDVGFAAGGGSGGSDEKSSNAAINATCRAVRTTGKKLNELIQTGIEQCIIHANTYGDCTGAARLVDAIPQTARRNEVINHFADYSPIRIVLDNRTKLMKASLRKEGQDGYHPFNVDGIKANPWYERKSVTEREPGMPFNWEQGKNNIFDLADKLYNKSVAKNIREEGPNGVERERNAVVNDDRQYLSALSSLVRAVARNVEDAAKALNLPKDVVEALKGHDKPMQDAEVTEDEKGGVDPDPMRQAEHMDDKPKKTGTEG